MRRTNDRARYCIYYPDEGRYSVPMTLPEAKAMVRQFTMAYIVNLETAEIYG